MIFFLVPARTQPKWLSVVMNPIPNNERNQGEGMERSTSSGIQPGGDDAVLIARIRRCDQDAFALLYDRYSPLVYSVALRVLKDPAAAEDVLHDIFLQLWRLPGKFDAARGNFSSWIAVVTRNRAIDRTRRERPRVDPEDVVLISPVDIESDAQRNSIAEKVRNVLHEMPEAQRNAVEMAFFDGMTHVEIADAMHEPLGTVKTRIRSALIMIRRAFE
jgi:RNA polymerase sigma-70 factor (ECF subfamily)